MSGPLLDAARSRTLADATGLPLGAYRRDHVQACVVKVLRRHEARDIPALIQLVDTDPDLRTRLRRAIAVSTTGLFRDPNQLRWLDASVMPSVTAGAKYLRALSAGCGAGEEAFTLAMMLEWHGMLGRCEVVGADILEESLAEAEEGVSGGARIPASLRSRVRWDQCDLTRGAPDGRFEIVLCRNLMSLLTPVAADAMARSLADVLTPGGVLVVARDERVEAPEALGLAAISSHAYRRVR